MAKNVVKLEEMNSKNPINNSKHLSFDLTQVERDFKRLKVDESDKQSISCESKADKPFNDCNYFSIKPISPKISCNEKRQSVNGFRRQRLHGLTSNRVPNNSRNRLESTTRSTDEGLECVAKDNTFCTDFSELKLNSKTQSIETNKCLYFGNDFELESNEWRDSLQNSYSHKKCTNSENNTNSKLKANKIRKLKFKQQENTCARQAMCDQTYQSSDASVDELAAYLDDTLYLPRKMSFMAEMMYT